MQTAKQISVRLVNKPGRLAQILGALAKERAGIVALAMMDSDDRSTLRFVPDDYALARSALETINVRYEVAEVLLAEVSSQNGAFLKICERLAGEHLNIDYAYSSSGGSRGESRAVIKVNDLAKAQRVLSMGSSNGKTRVKHLRRRPARAR